MSKNEVANTANQMPDYIKQNATRGSEEVGLDDITIPRIDVLQDLSPQIKKSKSEYIEGAEAGVLFNTLTGELYPDGIQILPIYFRKNWLVWKDQNKGGGLRGIYDNQAEAEQFIATQEDAGDLEAVETAENIVYIIDADGGFQEAAFSLSKSKLKINRKFNSLVRLQGGDRFSRVYSVRAVDASNAAGQDYYNVAVDYAEGGDGAPVWPTEEQYMAAELLYDNISSGKREVKVDSGAAASSDDGGKVADEF